MKKNLAMRVASLVLMCTIVTSCFVSSTFAKYTSSATGSDTVTVARWDVSIKDGSGASVNENASLNLFDSVTEMDGESDNEVRDGYIAPGTKGSFKVVITNNSDVKVDYNVEFAVSGNNSIPFKYCLTENGNYVSDLASLAQSETIDMATVNGETRTPTTKTITVYWQWPYESGNDTNDTTIGTAAGDVTVTATITATQANTTTDA